MFGLAVFIVHHRIVIGVQKQLAINHHCTAKVSVIKKKIKTRGDNYFISDCTTTVHQNTCKDNIVECNKPKTSKVINRYRNFFSF